ncbi:MAG: hypothetical protein LBP36_01885 [Oscillospiraceae bacterium]|jgi:hypothetical protein|nr:hypothetical protein [Oscillospiraceae bacterium]
MGNPKDKKKGSLLQISRKFLKKVKRTLGITTALEFIVEHFETRKKVITFFHSSDNMGKVSSKATRELRIRSDANTEFGLFYKIGGNFSRIRDNTRAFTVFKVLQKSPKNQRKIFLGRICKICILDYKNEVIWGTELFPPPTNRKCVIEQVQKELSGNCEYEFELFAKVSDNWKAIKDSDIKHSSTIGVRAVEVVSIQIGEFDFKAREDLKIVDVIKGHIPVGVEVCSSLDCTPFQEIPQLSAVSKVKNAFKVGELSRYSKKWVTCVRVNKSFVEIDKRTTYRGILEKFATHETIDEKRLFKLPPDINPDAVVWGSKIPEGGINLVAPTRINLKAPHNSLSFFLSLPCSQDEAVNAIKEQTRQINENCCIFFQDKLAADELASIGKPPESGTLDLGCRWMFFYEKEGGGSGRVEVPEAKTNFYQLQEAISKNEGKRMELSFPIHVAGSPVISIQVSSTNKSGKMVASPAKDVFDLVMVTIYNFGTCGKIVQFNKGKSNEIRKDITVKELRQRVAVELGIPCWFQMGSTTRDGEVIYEDSKKLSELTRNEKELSFSCNASVFCRYPDGKKVLVQMREPQQSSKLGDIIKTPGMALEGANELASNYEGDDPDLVFQLSSLKPKNLIR